MKAIEWYEGGQRFRHDGSCIRSLKPAQAKLPYGDALLEEIRAERARLNPIRRGRFRRLLGRLIDRDAQAA